MTAGHQVDCDRLTAAVEDKRLSLGLTAREVAEQAGVSPSLLSRMKAGGRRPDLDGFFALVSWLGASADEFRVDKPQYIDNLGFRARVFLLLSEQGYPEQEKRYLRQMLSLMLDRIDGRDNMRS